MLAFFRSRWPVGSRLNPTFVFLGDYGDRGHHTPQVIDALIEFGKEYRCQFLRGNHDQTLLDFLVTPKVGKQWMKFGGRETLTAYGLTVPSTTGGKKYWAAQSAALSSHLPANHLAFFKGTVLKFQAGDFLFVHAGIKPGLPITKQQPQDLMWIRDRFLKHRKRHEKFVVHGHTPSETIQKKSNRLGLDTAVYATGRLSGAVITHGGFEYLTATSDGVTASENP